MNYTKIYNQLCESRKYRPLVLERHYEIHHIVPRCVGGTNEESNLVKFTYREHYIAHHLLTKMYSSHVGIRYSFLCMLRNPHGKRILTSRMVETIKTNFSEFKKWHNRVAAPGKHENSRKAARERMLSNRNPVIVNPLINPGRKGGSVELLDGTIKTYDFLKDLAKEEFNDTWRKVKVKSKKAGYLESFGIKAIVVNEVVVAVQGRKWYNDGINNIYIKGEPPSNFLPGMVYSKRKT